MPLDKPFVPAAQQPSGKQGIPKENVAVGTFALERFYIASYCMNMHAAITAPEKEVMCCDITCFFFTG